MTDSVSSEADQRKSRIAGLFSRAASTYDQVGPRFFTHYGRRLVELAQVSQGGECTRHSQRQRRVPLSCSRASRPDRPRHWDRPCRKYG